MSKTNWGISKDLKAVLLTIDCSYCAKRDKVISHEVNPHAKKGKLIAHYCQRCHKGRNHYVVKIEPLIKDEPEKVVFS